MHISCVAIVGSMYRFSQTYKFNWENLVTYAKYSSVLSGTTQLFSLFPYSYVLWRCTVAFIASLLKQIKKRGVSSLSD